MSPEGLEASLPAELPTEWGDFRVVAFRIEGESCDEHIAIMKGDPSGDDVLARVHSSCITGDVLGSCRCDCGPQLRFALQRIEKEGRGVVLYLNQEGRGIGLFNKIRAYTLQDEGANTVEANVQLGFKPDARDYAQAANMLRHLGIKSVRLMTNNPAKVLALEEAGIPVSSREPHQVGANKQNRGYLDNKRDLMGHLF